MRNNYQTLRVYKHRKVPAKETTSLDSQEERRTEHVCTQTAGGLHFAMLYGNNLIGYALWKQL